MIELGISQAQAQFTKLLTQTVFILDTNIFLDLILKRDDYNSALIILNAIEKRVFEGVIADITVLNIDYIAKKQ